MVALTITTNADEVRRALFFFGSSQVPFAAAKALSNCAREGADAARARLEQVFELRSKGGNRGIRWVRAEKRDWPAPSSRVEWRSYLARHQAGGVQEPEGRSFAVPTRFVAAQRTSGGKIPARYKPRDVLAAERGFVQAEGEIGGEPVTHPWLLAKRARLKNLRLLFGFVRRVRLRAVLKAPETIAPVLATRFPIHFRAELDRALQSAR